MKVQIDTIQCRRLYERLRSGRAQLEQAQRDVQHARMHLRAQTCPAQKQALRQAEQAVENADYTAFDSMISELQRLEDELKQPDAQA